MNCLCCGRPLREENGSGWHKACIKRFFGTVDIPKIEIDEKTLELLAIESTNKGLTVPGVQKKVVAAFERRKQRSAADIGELPNRLYP